MNTQTVIPHFHTHNLFKVPSSEGICLFMRDGVAHKLAYVCLDCHERQNIQNGTIVATTLEQATQYLFARHKIKQKANKVRPVRTA